MFLFKTFLPPTQASTEVLTENFITVEAAARETGYNIQYLRRLLRAGRLEGVRIGQVWLIKISSLEGYLSQNESREDQRRGPRLNCIHS